MKRATLLMLAVFASSACSDIVSPETDVSVEPNHALVEGGIAYTQIDEQIRRLYDFNNCLSGLPPYSQWSPNCTREDISYEVATIANWQLTSVFYGDVTTPKANALYMLDFYMWLMDEAYNYGRVSCRARYATLRVASTLRAIVNSINGSGTVNLSALPQPLTANLWDLNLFAGANYNGTPCGAAPGLPFAALNGYTVVALNTSCADGGRSLELAGNEFYVTNSAHSNASVRVTGDMGVIYNNATYRCTQTDWGTDNYLGNGLTQVSGSIASPITYTPTGIPCTYSRSGNFNLDNNGSHWVGGTSASRRLNPGVYCATGNITLTRDDVVGTVTFNAGGRVDLRADFLRLRAFHSSGVVAYAGSNAIDAILVTGMYNSFSGYLYSPAGRIDIQGQDFTLIGAMVAHRIRLLGVRSSVVSATP